MLIRHVMLQSSNIRNILVFGIETLNQIIPDISFLKILYDSKEFILLQKY